MEQHLPYWHQSAALDAQLAKIIADLTELLDEHSDGQPYPWGHVEDTEGTEGTEGL